MRIIRWSLDHSRLVLGGYTLCLVLALLALTQLIPTRLTPAVSPSQLVVVTQRPNLPAAAVEQTVTRPLERKLAELSHLRGLRSQSMMSTSLIFLDFPYGQDLEPRRVEAQALAGGDSVVLPVDPLNLPVVTYAVTSASSSREQLQRFLEADVSPRLRQVPGVSAVTVLAPRQRVELEVDRLALQRAGLTLESVETALRGSRVDHWGARFEDALGDAQSVRMQNRPDGTDQLLALPLTDQLALGQVASARLMPDHESASFRFNAQECLLLQVVQTATASSPATVAAVQLELRRQASAHGHVRFEQAYNNSDLVTRFRRQCRWELLLALTLAAATVYAWLRDARGTLLIMATVPASLSLTVLAFSGLGLSFNSSSLIGLLLAIGRVVDDTIIDLHAIQSQRAAGQPVHEAALAGCSGVRRAVFASTWVMALAMLPLTFAGGLTQDMFEGICWPFLLAILASLLVSLTLTPVLAVRVYQGTNAPRPVEGTLERGYRNSLDWALRYRGVVLWAAACACYLAWTLYPLLGWEMMPLSDTGQLHGQLETQPHLSPAETVRLTQQVETLLLQQPEVRKVMVEVGPVIPSSQFTGYSMGGPHGATFWVSLVDKSERRRNLWEIADRVQLQAMGSFYGLRRLSLREMGSDVMASPMAPVQLVITGPNPQRLAWLGEQAVEIGQSIPGLCQVSSSWSLDEGAVALRVDPGAGTAANVSRQLQRSLGVVVPGVTCQGLPLVLSYRADQRRTLADLPEIAEKRVEETPEPEPGMYEHENLTPSITVSASYRSGGPGSMKLGMDWMHAVHTTVPLPAGYHVQQRGDMVLMMDSTARLWRGLLIAVGLIYAVLASYFGSWKIGLVILLTIPLELGGVFAALLLAGQTLSSVSLLGLVVLHGMDATAAILLLDSVMAHQGRLGLREAVLLGAPQRLRPVAMTVMVTLAVMLPLAFFPSTGMDAYSPLATVVFGGLLFSTLLTMWVVPVIYYWLHAGARDLNAPHETSPAL